MISSSSAVDLADDFLFELSLEFAFINLDSEIHCLSPCFKLVGFPYLYLHLLDRNLFLCSQDFALDSELLNQVICGPVFP